MRYACILMMLLSGVHKYWAINLTLRFEQGLFRRQLLIRRCGTLELPGMLYFGTYTYVNVC